MRASLTGIVEGQVLIVEPRDLVRRATTRLLVRHGPRVVAVGSAQAAAYLPHHFHCGIFNNNLPDANAISLVGWLLAERRIDNAVFFGETGDVDVRLRASNLGTFVGYAEGLHHLVRAALDYLADPQLSNCGLGIPSLRISAFAGIESRYKSVV